MKFLVSAILVLFTGVSTFAQDNEVTCKVKLNSELQFDFTLVSPEGQKIVVGEFDGYKVLLNHAADSQFSLEIYDIDQSMRTYSDAPLRNLNDVIANTIWKRDVLVETSCQLHK